MKKLLIMMFFMGLMTASLMADVITLKDGQEFSADVTVFDSFYVTVKLIDGQEVAIPWTEVRAIKHTTTAQSWLEETYISLEDAEVLTLVVPLSKDTAFYKSLFPGVGMHGAGHFYAKDKNMGMSLLSAEIVAVIMMALNVSEIIQPEEGSQATVVSQVVFFTGLTIFGGSWLYDIIFSGGAVEKFNNENTFLIQEKKENAGSPGQ